MNITLLRLKPIVKELRDIRLELARIADCMEMDMSDRGINIRPPKADTSGPEPTVSFTDEEHDYVRELIERDKELRGVANTGEDA